MSFKPTMNPARRQLVQLLGAGALLPTWPGLSLAAPGPAEAPRLVVIMLRGALDGLAAVPVPGDPAFAALRGELAPVFFGSAVNNFGVRKLLECFVRIAPSPRPAPTATRTVEPAEPKMTGFVFKIHANMDPNHRDRIAFLKICSGTFERNHNYLHVRSGKQLKFSSPTAFMAEKKSVIDFA